MSSDVIYFAHALDTSPMRARVLTQKSEEATASSASLLATPLYMVTEGFNQFLFHLQRRCEGVCDTMPCKCFCISLA